MRILARISFSLLLAARSLAVPIASETAKGPQSSSVRSRQPAPTWRGRRLEPLRCNVISFGACFLQTPSISFDDDAQFSPGSFLDPSGSPITKNETVEDLVIALGSSVECATGGYCQLTFRDFRRIQIDGSLTASDIVMEVNTLIIGQSGILNGSNLGHTNGVGDSPAGERKKLADGMSIWAASHGGRGGWGGCVSCQCYASHETYGSEESPTDFGSGGFGRSTVRGGGRINIAAIKEVTIDGMLSEDGSSCPLKNECASASGGSVLIKSEKVLGAGTIQAKGGGIPAGSGRETASGGGGRIAIHSNILSSTLTITAAGGTVPSDFSGCPSGYGESGTVYTGCLSSICYNGGEKTGGCGCSCVAPWSGPDCSTCPVECANGGQLDPISCTCNCPFGWAGQDCTACSAIDLCNGNGTCNVQDQSCACLPNFFGNKCETYCDELSTCQGSGICSSDGKSCECFPGKVGNDCFCDARDCSAANACSGNGFCQVSECICSRGFVGCDCAIECLDSTHCSGNGVCNRDGTCSCFAGFIGSNCAQQDYPTYCSDKTNTVTGFPCIPLVADLIGHGFNAINGETTTPIVPLKFSEGRTFTIRGTTFEIPDDVACNEVTETIAKFTTHRFQSTSAYRQKLATEIGLSGMANGVFISGSTAYNYVYQHVFLQQRTLFESDLVHGIYECQFRNQAAPTPSLQALEVMDSMAENRLVQALGTHYVSAATFGGRVRVHNYVEACVFNTLESYEIEAEVSSSVLKLAASPSVKGKVGTEVDRECSAYAEYSMYSTSIEGGKRQLLIIPGADSVEEDFRSWFDSLEESPGVVGLRVQGISFVLPSVVDQVDAYIQSFNAVDELEIQPGPEAGTCPVCVKSGAYQRWLLFVQFSILFFHFVVSAVHITF